MEVNEVLRQFIVENFLFGERGNLSDDTSFLESGVIDSTGVLELVLFLEKRFGVSVEDDELIPENLDSISSATRFIEEKMFSHANQFTSRDYPVHPAQLP